MTPPAATATDTAEALAAVAARRGRRAPRVEHPTREERAARGRAARATVPRSSHGDLAPAAGRPDPIALLERQAESRVPDLVPIRYGRMMVSPFTFYRGAALVMASDLAATPRSGISVQACGDAHLANFGVFGSPERRLLFDVNDFDETLPGPWEWDVKRLAASIEVAARDRGFTPAQREEAVLECGRTYREAMSGFAGMRNLEVWYASLDVETVLAEHRAAIGATALRRAERNIAKARTRDSMQAFSKLTRVVDGRPRIVADPPLVVPLEDLVPGVTAEQIAEALRELVRRYRRTLVSDRRHLLEQFEFQEAAHKVVGVGSVGLRAWIMLFLGVDGGDPLFLQAKEAQASVLEAFVGRSRYRNAGQRVVDGQRLLQAASDIFLGWERVVGADGVTRDFYVRQLRDWKGSADLDAIEPGAMRGYARMCAWTLARGHARSGDRVAIAAYLGKGDVFERAVQRFAVAYADQNERDHEALLRAVKKGRIEARTGL